MNSWMYNVLIDPPSCNVSLYMDEKHSEILNLGKSKFSRIPTLAGVQHSSRPECTDMRHVQQSLFL